MSAGYNLDSGNSCGFNGIGDLNQTNPLLGPLDYYGGHTPTHSILYNSPAIDAGSPTDCPATDQRGVIRPIDGDGDNNPICDMGAFEYTTLPIISISDASVFEGNMGTESIVFTITVSTPSTQTISLIYTTVDGTAQAGTDYYAAADTIQFAPGEITHTISVTVFGDSEVEPDETFTVELANAAYGIIGDGVAVGTILNDDVAVSNPTIFLPLMLKP